VGCGGWRYVVERGYTPPIMAGKCFVRPSPRRFSEIRKRVRAMGRNRSSASDMKSRALRGETPPAFQRDFRKRPARAREASADRDNGRFRAFAVRPCRSSKSESGKYHVCRVSSGDHERSAIYNKSICEKCARDLRRTMME